MLAALIGWIFFLSVNGSHKWLSILFHGHAKAPGFVRFRVMQRMKRLCVPRHSFSSLPDISPLSLLVKAVIGCPVCCVSVIGSYKTKRLYLIGSGSAFGSVLNESDKGVSCLNFEFDIFRYSLGERPLCPAKTNYSSGKDKNVKCLSPLLWPIIHLLICFGFFVCLFCWRGMDHIGHARHVTPRQQTNFVTLSWFCFSLFARFKLTPIPLLLYIGK